MRNAIFCLLLLVLGPGQTVAQHPSKKVQRDTTSVQAPELVLQTGHKTLLNSIVLSRSGTMIASGGADGVIKLWDAQTHTLLRTFFGHSGWVNGMSFMQNDEQLLSCGWDGDIKIWDVQTGEEIAGQQGVGEIRAMALDSAEKNLVLVGNACQVFKLSPGKLTPHWRFETGSLMTGVCFIPGTAKFAVGGWDSKVHLYNLEEKLEEPSNYEVDKWIFDVSITQDGQYLCSVGHEVAVWNTRTGQKLKVPRDVGFCWAAAFHPRSHLLALAFEYDSVLVWNLDSGQITIVPASEKSSSIVFNPEYPAVLFGGEDGTVNIFDLLTSETVRLTGEAHFAAGLGFSPNGQWLAIGWGYQNGYIGGEQRPNVRLWNLISGQQEAPLHSRQMEVKLIRYNQRGDLLAVGDEMEIDMWSLPSRNKFAHIDCWADDFGFSGDQHIYAKTSRYAFEKWNFFKALSKDSSQQYYWAGFSKNGQWAALFNSDYHLTMKNLKTGNDVVRGLRTGGMGPLAISENGQMVAYGDVGSTVTVLDVPTHKKIHSFPLYESHEQSAPAECITFSRTGKILACGGSNRATIWNVRTGRKIAVMRDHPGKLLALDISPDEKLLVTAADGESGIVRLWDMQTGKLLASLVSIQAGKDWLVIAPDGLFDGTWEAIAKVGWRVGLTTNVNRIESFYNDYFRPGLLADLANGLRPKATVDIATVLQLPGLREMMKSGMAKVERANGKTILYLTQRPTARSQVYVDGHLLDYLPEEMLQTADHQWRYKVELPGDVQFELVHKTDQTITNKDQILRKHTTSNLGDATMHVQLVGVDKYDLARSGFKPLKNSVVSAQQVGAFFKAQGADGNSLYKKINLLPPLYDSLATVQAIRTRLIEIADTAHAQDVVVLFFIGHGIVPVGQEMFFFGCYDMKGPNPKDQVNTGFNTAMLVDAIRAIKARRIVLIIDACQSGGAIESLRKIADLKRSAAPGDSNNRTISPHISVIVSSSPLEQALQPTGATSVLTQSLLEALSDSSPNNTGSIWISDIVQTISLRIPALSAHAGQTHTPMIISSGEDFPIAKPVSRQR
ncbi:hypothetical protein HB364_13535 [Pseudoflavitalea sp. X16]|uniref:caspase family protein n=1 Tax=Paraflavitalea devenefica TaxID=2716334 RepID=UPI00142179FA|nr:caspase family protein [Paraflavitalea devenefica]NII26111.1 hypothetical protein [Paraflavitalea devenefica]